MQGFSKADEQRRARDITAVRQAAPSATSMQGLAEAAEIKYPRLYNLLQVMPDGEAIRAAVATAKSQQRLSQRRAAGHGPLLPKLRPEQQ